MKDDESIQDMHTRFTSIINELHSLGEIIPRNKLVRKILSVLPSSWESKANAITEAKDLQKLTIDELVGNLRTYKMKKKRTMKEESPKERRTWSSRQITMIQVVRMSDDDEDDDDDEKEKNALDEKIANIEHERDDLMVVVVDLKETIEYLRKEKDVLTERVANIEHERDDLLMVVVDLKETIGELKMESRHENSQKGKEVASEAHIKLESELNSVKSSLCAELEKNK
ncbi:GRIP domain-containing protein RUD3-like [Nicotiana tomentosiformis]|uniref:GRIP domain-containing protein RUD3-like n=1 Tax=Nicotiana tomentosiformis TaxID=4098 RepID=UPI00388C7195